MGLHLTETVDHIDGDGLNCRRSNLRDATPRQNVWNSRLAKTNTSGYKGVSFDRRRGRWHAYIIAAHKQNDLGHFDSAEEAAAAVVKARAKLHGEFARFA